MRITQRFGGRESCSEGGTSELDLEKVEQTETGRSSSGQCSTWGKPGWYKDVLFEDYEKTTQQANALNRYFMKEGIRMANNT